VDGNTGFKQALAAEPDFMIMDLQLPGRSGIGSSQFQEQPTEDAATVGASSAKYT
jgi:DNA-binding NarL/FixJ family response regulator